MIESLFYHRIRQEKYEYEGQNGQVWELRRDERDRTVVLKNLESGDSYNRTH